MMWTRVVGGAAKTAGDHQIIITKDHPCQHMFLFMRVAADLGGFHLVMIHLSPSASWLLLLGRHVTVCITDSDSPRTGQLVDLLFFQK
jgi:hypothetical protein